MALLSSHQEFLPDRHGGAYGGEDNDLPAEILQQILDEISAGRHAIPVHNVYRGLEQVREARTEKEADVAVGKLV